MIRTVATGYSAQANRAQVPAFRSNHLPENNMKTVILALANDPTITPESKSAIGDVFRKVGTILAANKGTLVLSSADLLEIGQKYAEEGTSRHLGIEKLRKRQKY